MRFRIKKYIKGYVVEVEQSKWYGKRYWTHFISVAGMNHEPWYHSTYNHAETNLLNKVTWDTIINSR